MNDILSIVKSIFNDLKIFIFLIPIFALIFYINKKSFDRFILFMGTSLIILSKLVIWYFPAKNKVINEVDRQIILKENINNFIALIFVWIGIVSILVGFYFITKNEWKLKDKVLFDYLKKMSIEKSFLLLGILLFFIGQIISFFYTSLEISHYQLDFILNTLGILITWDQFFIIIGIFFFLLGLFWLILLKNRKI